MTSQAMIALSSLDEHELLQNDENSDLEEQPLLPRPESPPHLPQSQASDFPDQG
eukprot:CAMPEP_0170459756 /NCGR_PEP_ID=MMETSP0123-20130129/6336_1 /TAXON_ID=182087 /ORGANISM="Favella ehrenbergii, Strain Fehren 1" /LENGTH=53 /DNA_ID=CAMNT_0010724443 /DNA_START=41 /DNA_END=202 /DNA_ORIENTATION=-